MSSKWLHQVCRKRYTYQYSNNVNGTSAVCDNVWQMECHADAMTDGKAMHADDTTQNLMTV